MRSNCNLSLKDNYLCALDIVAGFLLKIFQCTSKDRYNNLYLQARLQLERILKSVRISKNSVTKEGGLRCLPLSCFGIPSCLALTLAGRGARPSRKPSGPAITGDLSLAEGHSIKSSTPGILVIPTLLVQYQSRRWGAPHPGGPLLKTCVQHYGVFGT